MADTGARVRCLAGERQEQMNTLVSVRLDTGQIEADDERHAMHVVASMGGEEAHEARLPVVARGDVTIGVVDDHDLVSQLLVGVLSSAGFRAYAAYSEDPAELAETVAARGTDIVLLDYYLGEQTAEAFIEQLLDRDVTVIMLTAADDLLTIAQCVEAGAAGHLSKGVSPDELVRSVEVVVTGGELLSEDDRFELRAALLQEKSRLEARLAPFTRLTDRERQTLLAICQGRSAAQMAEDWDVSVATVRSHIRAVLVKLDAGSQLEAAALARRVGWPDALSDIEA